MQYAFSAKWHVHGQTTMSTYLQYKLFSNTPPARVSYCYSLRTPCSSYTLIEPITLHCIPGVENRVQYGRGQREKLGLFLPRLWLRSMLEGVSKDGEKGAITGYCRSNGARGAGGGCGVPMNELPWQLALTRRRATEVYK